MARFSSLPENVQLGDVFKRFPIAVEPLLEYHDQLLRGPSPLSIAERELIAAYVSGVNACQFCFGAHSIIAEVHGVSADVMDKLYLEPENVLEPKWIPLLAYLKKLTQNPSGLRDNDSKAVFDAGWSEEALYHAVSVASLFNMMNRIVEGTGVVSNDVVRSSQRERHQDMKDHPTPYRLFGQRLGVVPE